MKNLKIGDTVLLRIQSLGKNGEGIAELEGKTIFIENALPEELLHVKIDESKTNYYRAEILETVKQSPLRDKPSCPLFGRCGGCQLMHMQYSYQLQFKRERVKAAFAKFSLKSAIESCLPSPSPLGYRNKIQLPVQNGKIGLYAKDSHEIIELEGCPVHCTLGESVFQKIRSIIPPVQYILIKTSIHQEQAIVTLIASESEPAAFKATADEIMKASAAITGVMLNVNKQQCNTILGSEYHLLAGIPYITEKLGDLSFRISPASFFQINSMQAEKMYSKAIEICNPQSHETVLDAYCGVGSISIYFARCVKQVIGIECVPKAIEDAKTNAELNGIKNTHFHQGFAEEFMKDCDPVDLLILNPPRKGCASSLLQSIRRLKPAKILYISCEPETLARDLSHLISIGYTIEITQPLDMFPQTVHVETLVFLKITL